MNFKRTKTRLCYGCQIMLTDSKGKPLPEVRMHCDSPTCDYCAECRHRRGRPR